MSVMVGAVWSLGSDVPQVVRAESRGWQSAPSSVPSRSVSATSGSVPFSASSQFSRPSALGRAQARLRARGPSP